MRCGNVCRHTNIFSVLFYSCRVTQDHIPPRIIVQGDIYLTEAITEPKIGGYGSPFRPTFQLDGGATVT